MSEQDIKKEMRQLIMLVSSIRSQDQDHWESHVEFSNQVIEFIKKIQKDMNNNWDKINNSVLNLNKSIEESLDSLLTGINPDSIKQTSQSLKEIQETMGKTVQAINLDGIMKELQGLSGEGIVLSGSGVSKGKKGKSKKKGATKLDSGSSGPYSADDESISDEALDADGYTQEEQEMIKAYQEIYGPGQIPAHLKKKKKKKDPHLLKPSDFFGM
ncbi:hypothetical protein NEF87_003653 [Candidatus Lokiarchaeum ossiferum]|uniref:Uncharacterized protein n=1 Tax=Candidatus Lokiarchaeum ossiferum TaxID=2951803 RepID=A0ABY6HV25_9ARCH|nr:hypothetical protein NEF87_003653 [Candidatus Lokiarchaeum sp. B-35]